MTVKDLQCLFEYGYWANGQLLRVVSQLAPDQFTRQVAGGYGSIRNTLVHMLSAEGGCLDRCGGPKRGAPLKPEDFPTLESITSRWATLEGSVHAFLDSLSDADLSREIQFTVPLFAFSRRMTMGEILHHAAIHSIHHRGQVALLVRALGQTPGNFDLLFYDAETRSGVPQ